MLRLAAMQKIDRQVAFTGTKEVAEPLRFDPARLEAYLAREVRGLCRAADGAAVQGRPVEPDLSAGNAGAQIRAAAEAAGQAAAVGARGRSRVPRHQRAARRRAFPVAEPVIYCADESVAGTRVLRHGLRRGPRVLEPGDAGLATRPSARRSTTR